MAMYAALRAALAARLRPIVAGDADPDIDLRIGLLRSSAVLKDVELDVGVINDALPESSPVVVKGFRVRELSARLSPWSKSAVELLVRGVDVSMDLREPVVMRRPFDAKDERRKVMAYIDQQGTFLHEMMESCLLKPVTGHLSTILPNTILRCSHVSFEDVVLRIHCIDDSHAFVLRTNGIRIGPDVFRRSSLFGGLIRSFLTSAKSTEFVVDCPELDILFEDMQLIHSMASFAGISAVVGMDNLQLGACNLRITHVGCQVAVESIPLLSALLNMVRAKEQTGTRSGKELWRIAAERVPQPISVQKAVRHAIFMQRYVRVYSALLLLVGYPSGTEMSANCLKMSHDNLFKAEVKQLWSHLVDLEDKIPAVAVVRARHIARMEICTTSGSSSGKSWPELIKDQFWKFYYVLIKLFRFLLSGCLFVIRIFSLLNFVSHQKTHRSSSVSDNLSPQLSYGVYVGDLRINFASLSLLDGSSTRSLPFAELLLYSLCVHNAADCVAKSIIVALGECKVSLSGEQGVFWNERGLRIKRTPSVKSGDSHNHEMEDIFWVDPASFHSLKTEDSISFITESTTEELTSLWTSIRSMFLDMGVDCGHEPSFLLKYKSSLVDPYRRSENGFLQCYLTLGKLNLHLEHVSILSLFMLYKLFEKHNSLTSNFPVEPNVFDSCPADEASLSDYAFFTSKAQVAVQKIGLDNTIQIESLIAGPHIRVAVERDVFTSQPKMQTLASTTIGNSNCYICVQLVRIELAISPSPNISASDRNADNLNSQPLWSKDESTIYVLKENCNTKDATEVHTSTKGCFNIIGLTVMIDDLPNNREFHIAGPINYRSHMTSSRVSGNSLLSLRNVIRITLNGNIEGATFLLFIDELYTSFQVFNGMVSVVSSEYANLNDSTCNYRDFLKILSSSQKNALPGNKRMCNGHISLERMLDTENHIFTEAALNVERIDIILKGSRGNFDSLPGADVNAAISSAIRFLGMSYFYADLTRESMLNYLVHGLGFCSEGNFLKISFSGQHLKARINIANIQSILFDDQILMSTGGDILQYKNMPTSYMKNLCRLTLCNCIFSLHCGSQDDSCSTKDGNSTNSLYHLSRNLNASCKREEKCQNCDISAPDYGCNSGTRSTMLSMWPLIIIEIMVDDVYVGSVGWNVNSAEVLQPKEYKISIQTFDDPQTINCDIKGGLILLETKALCEFIYCYRTVILLLMNLPLWASKTNNNKLLSKVEAKLSSSSYPERKPNYFSSINYCSADISAFSIALAHVDQSGETHQLVVEVDMTLELLNFGKIISFELKRLSVFTNSSSHSKNYARNVPMSQIRSAAISSDDEIQELDAPAVGSYSTERPQCRYILRQLVATLNIETLNSHSKVCLEQWSSDWCGNGSISGCDLTITLSSIKVLSSLVAPLRGVFSNGSSEKSVQKVELSNEAHLGNSDFQIPDGATIALLDLHQRMYIAIEIVGEKYCLVGTRHYSLVDGMSFFKVRHHRSSTSEKPVVSFMSLHAKSGEGRPMCLIYCPRSGSIQISAGYDKPYSLWNMFSPKKASTEEDNSVQSYNITPKNSCYLVNQKYKHGIAFVDGRLEFVKKPGNLFKVKLFESCLEIGRAVAHSNVGIHNNFTSSVASAHSDAGTRNINVTVDNITVAFNEYSDANEVPLIELCCRGVHVIAQACPSKFRVFNMFTISVQYFDALKNSWEKLVSPVCSFFFFRTRYASKSAPCEFHKMPQRYFISIEQVDIYIKEIAVDILLYFFGKLEIISPYAVRSSAMFPNFCKIENNTGLSVFCNLPSNEVAEVSGNQSCTVSVRRMLTADMHVGNESTVSVSLVKQGAFTTSPIKLSLSEPQSFAWRTRLLSLKDSRSDSGPSIVIELSKLPEAGPLLSISPLLRIHNKSEFSLELQFRRRSGLSQESAFAILKCGDTIDDSMKAFDAMELSGELRKAWKSLALGNFALSIRPELSEHVKKFARPASVKWSEDIMGEKPIVISGLLEKLSYTMRNTFSLASIKSAFTTLNCPIFVEGQHATELYFLVHTMSRTVPLNSEGPGISEKSLPSVLQIQKEILIYPTIQVYNLLGEEISVIFGEESKVNSPNNIERLSNIPCGGSSFFYVNTAMFELSVILNSQTARCKPVKSGDLVRRLGKQNTKSQYVDTELQFASGKFCAYLRFLRNESGILQIVIFAKYELHNNTDFVLLCTSTLQRSFNWSESESHTSCLSPEIGCLLPSKSKSSWFTKSSIVYLRLLSEKTAEASVDLNVLSAHTEISLEVQSDMKSQQTVMLGISAHVRNHDLQVPSQVVLIAPRYAIYNESGIPISIRQCYIEGDGNDCIVGAKQQTTLKTWKIAARKEKHLLESFFKGHISSNSETHIYVQICLLEAGCGWSGPVCAASIGRFFLKFRTPKDIGRERSISGASHSVESKQFGLINIVQDNSTFVLQFYKELNSALPYRIENCLHGMSIVYSQKDSMESDQLSAGKSEDYVWDDLYLPHKLLVSIVDMNVFREINIDKVCAWKPFIKMRQFNMFRLDLSIQTKNSTTYFDEPFGLNKIGYEVYADGLTRVLRISELNDVPKSIKIRHPLSNLQFRQSCICVHILEDKVQIDSGLPLTSNLLVARFNLLSVDMVVADQHRYFSAKLQSLNMDEKWEGASFGSVIRRSQLDETKSSGNILSVIFVMTLSNSSVTEVDYSSIILQPIDIKVDEETLMKLVPFWRSSCGNSSGESQQYYFRQFELHPIKINASFRPGGPHSTYNSAQEMLRSLLHLVIKMPTINNFVIELNGVFLSHALVTSTELLLKCAQHYSWYILRGIYIAKGSQLLPLINSSFFDDSAFSSLDVFFDTSEGSLNLPGLTIGMFEFIKNNIKSKSAGGTKRYLGDLGKAVKLASSRALFAAVTEVSDNVLRGAELGGLNGMVKGFRQGILQLAMEPSFLGLAVMEGGSDRKIKLDRSPGLDEQYVEGYLQAMLDVSYKQEYLRVRVIDGQVILKNLPPSNTVINDIVNSVKSFLISNGLLKGDSPGPSRHLRRLQDATEWRIGPTLLTLCEHLFVSFAIRMLRRNSSAFIEGIWLKLKPPGGDKQQQQPSTGRPEKPTLVSSLSRFAFSVMVAYLDGRLCRPIPNPIIRRIVSGYLLSFIDNKDN